MNLRNHLCVSSFAALVIGAGIFGAGVSTAPAVESSQGMEVLTRGPVHEAFAETVSFDPTPGIIVTKQPPNLIEEVMPDQRPAGDNVAWIPGYWGWDEDQGDFLWISGIWRNLPPEREWIPGYWSALDTGHQWTSGYWQDAEADEVTYLPEPPRSLETGPNIAATSDDQTWMPGSWQYQENRYAWRAGTWVTARPNWCWTPSYYRWAPRGYVYVDGYWDYPVVSRGVIFAPVRFEAAYYEEPDFYYSPQTVISLSVFSNHLFLRPNYGHYYFGDYYESRYYNRYYPSYCYGSRYRGYDPIYNHYRWENRHDRNWDRQRQDYYEHRRDHADARPPQTWNDLNNRSEGDRERGDYGVADRYDRVVRNPKDGSKRFQSVSNDERQRFVSQKNDLRNYGRERQQREVNGGRAKGEQVGSALATREKANRSPLAGKRTDRSEKDGGPPERLQKRHSKRGEIASNGGGNRKASQTGRKDLDRTEAPGGRQSNKRNENATADNTARTSRESRTQPGQRRADSGSTKGKQSQADFNGRPSAIAGGKAEVNRSPGSKGDARVPGQGERKQNQPRLESQANGKRPDSPNFQRQEQPAPQRQATPKNERRSPQSEPGRSSRQEAPSRKAQVAPTRQSFPGATDPRTQPQPQRQKVERQRERPRPQQALPQRQQSSRPEPRQAQQAPQRQRAEQPRPQQAQPQRQQASRSEPRQTQQSPQRQRAEQPRPQQAQPQRQQAPRSEPRQTQQVPQRQRSEPQRQQQSQNSAARPQAEPRSSGRGTESKSGDRRSRQD